ncbi:MAG: hypothetical protein ACRDTZ_07640, partial [Pseudonocardiaceae bacterium]
MTSTQTPRTEEALRAELAAQLLTARTGRASPGGPARPKGLKRLTEAPPPPPAVNHPAYAAEVVALIGAAAHAAQINPYWLVAGGGLAALSTGLNVHARYHHRPATTYAAVSSLAAGGIGAAIAEHGLVSGWGALALAGGMVGLGPVYGSLRRRHDKRTEKESLERKAEIAARKRSDWERILFDAGVKGIRIETELTDDEWTNGEQSFPIGSDSPAGFALAVELGKDSPEGSMLAGMTPRIEKEAARQLRLPIRSGAIRVEPRGYAHQWKLIIPTKDLLRETVPFVLEKGPRTINDPLYVAMSADGMALGVDFNTTPHGLVAGITGNGKTTFLNVHILESTRCVDTVNWYICGDKPTRVLRPWMEAFLNGTSSDVSGTGYVEPILDWIATDIQEACHMLLDAYKAVSIRQAMPAEPGASEEKWSPSRNRPRICIWMDEAPKFLTNNQYKVKTWDWTGSRTTEQEDAEGLPRTGYTFSELLLEVIRLARSEGISVVFMLQRPTNDMAGDSGGGLKSQLGYRTSFKQAGGLEQGKTFISDALGVDVKTLGIGELYMESGEVSRPILGKSYYAQWDDIRAATVAHTAYQQPLDPETAADLDFYAGRWTRQ